MSRIHTRNLVLYVNSIPIKLEEIKGGNASILKTLIIQLKLKNGKQMKLL